MLICLNLLVLGGRFLSATAHQKGALAVAGPWKKSEALHTMVENKPYIWPWQRSPFARTGQL